MIEEDGWLYPELADLLQTAGHWDLLPAQDARKIDSACARPRAAFGDYQKYTDVASKAAALGWSVARSHGLIDGNKRLGALAMLHFCHANGYTVAMTPGELVALFLQIARGHMDEEELCLFLRSRIVLADL